MKKLMSRSLSPRQEKERQRIYEREVMTVDILKGIIRDLRRPARILRRQIVAVKKSNVDQEIDQRKHAYAVIRLLDLGKALEYFENAIEALHRQQLNHNWQASGFMPRETTRKKVSA